jgi:predicted MPP superfamily phosphohydrolase
VNLVKTALGLSVAGAGLLVYGALVESDRLVVEKKTLRLAGWPERLDGFRIAVLGDLHLTDKYSVERAKRTVAMALDEGPDMVVLPGDFVSYWKPESAWLIGEVLEPLLLMEGNVVAVPGNHDHYAPISLLASVLEQLNIKLLINETWRHQGVTWAGVDSFNAGTADPARTMASAFGDPVIALWHEPDLVDMLPSGACLQISGHSHGGQFRFPFGIVPMTSRNGKKYLGGFYPNAPTPLYVTRGVGTTGPPSRFLCPPEVSLLTLKSAS